MAKKTQLGPAGVPGKPYTFGPKTPAATIELLQVGGTLTIVASEQIGGTLSVVSVGQVSGTLTLMASEQIGGTVTVVARGY